MTRKVAATRAAARTFVEGAVAMFLPLASVGWNKRRRSCTLVEVLIGPPLGLMEGTGGQTYDYQGATPPVSADGRTGGS